MGPGGTTESIAHFIGYLRLLGDATRPHPTLEGAPGPVRSQAIAEAPHGDLRPDLTIDDGQSHPVALGYQAGPWSLLGVARHTLLPPPHSAAPHSHVGHVPPVEDAPHDPGPPALGALYRIDAAVPGGAWAHPPDQILADIRQANVLHDDGVVLTTPMTPVFEAMAVSHGLAGAQILPGLLDQAEAGTPDWLAAAGQGRSLADAVAAHDADPTAHAIPAIHPGLYADGSLQPDGTTFAPSLPATDPGAVSSHNGLTNPGADASTGGNTAINIATILDDHTQHTGLAVIGNLYTTDAIIQTNVLRSLADIAVGGLAGPQDVETGGDTAHNLASFAHHDLSASFASPGMPWAHLQLDTIRGDFYDVKAFSQLNTIANDDVVSQGAVSAFSEISTGGNLQVSDLSFAELAQSYDLIVVGGSFHNTNAVIQQNVFLDDAVVRSLSGRGDATSQSVSTGDNHLSNSASIDHYGTTATQPLTPDLAAWLTQLDHGSLDGEGAGAVLSTGSSTLHVLYVTGGFFDINLVTQTNIVSNVDTVGQVTAAGASPTGGPTASTMAVDTGHNQLANIAGIAVVGTTGAFQFVGGQHYDDAILVQANLVSDKAHVTIGDTHTLASELIAFTGAHDAAASLPDHAAPMATDPQLHHDLFHGIMT